LDLRGLLLRDGEGKGGRKGRGRGGRRKGRKEEKGKDPQGLVDTPMFQTLKNTLVITENAKQRELYKMIRNVASTKMTT